MFKYEMHMHTSESSACGKNDIHEMIKKYKSQGFEGAVLTNHFYFGNTRIDRNLPWNEFVEQFCRPYFEGQKTAKELDFDLLFGLEENYGGGKEFLVYGITPQFLYDRPQLLCHDNEHSPYCTERLLLWSREVHAAGGVLIYAHPFRNRAYIKEPYIMPDLSLADGVEVYNHCNTQEDNDKTRDTFAGEDIILIAGSDLHTTDFTSAAGICLPDRVKDEKALAESLKERKHTLLIP